MYTLIFASRFVRSFRKHRRSGRFPLQKFEKALVFLKEGVPLPDSYTDHALQGLLALSREFHLGYDLLVRYKRNETQRTVTLVQIGTHSELFGE